MKRYEIRGNPDKLCSKDVIESETGEWVKWEDIKDGYNPHCFETKGGEITQEENEARYQESLTEGN